MLSLKVIMRTHNANVMFYAAEIWLVQIVVNQMNISSPGPCYVVIMHGDPPDFVECRTPPWLEI